MSMKRTKIYNNVVEHRLLFDKNMCEDITSVQPPNLEHPTDTLEGEGLTADIEVANQSKVNAMELKISHNNGVNCEKLKEPGIHTVEYRLARQEYGVTKRTMGYQSVKYQMDVQHKGTEAGTIDTGFDTSEPEDLEPENTFAPPAATQQPTLDNAQDTDISAVQEQIYANQMGIG